MPVSPRRRTARQVGDPLDLLAQGDQGGAVADEAETGQAGADRVDPGEEEHHPLGQEEDGAPVDLGGREVPFTGDRFAVHHDRGAALATDQPDAARSGAGDEPEGPAAEVGIGQGAQKAAPGLAEGRLPAREGSSRPDARPGKGYALSDPSHVWVVEDREPRDGQRVRRGDTLAVRSGVCLQRCRRASLSVGTERV